MLKSFQNFHHLDNPQIPWNFSYQPRVVVVNLGQNDQCGNEPAATMTTSMVNFVQHVRGMLPKAQIAVMRPFGGPFEAAIKQAVDTLNAQGDKHVVYVDTTGWLKNPDDFRDGVHPNEIGSAKAAARLAPILKPYLK
jgi:lysophospholipase L1-like esterase